MAQKETNNFLDKIKTLWTSLFTTKKEKTGKVQYAKREKIVAFIMALLLALCLWFLVNLSRSFNLTVNVPLVAGSIPPDKALTQKLPEYLAVSVKGEGWSLISFYNNPPSVRLDINDGEIILLDQVREQMNTLPDVTITKVQPSYISINLEDNVTLKKEIKPQINLSFKDRYSYLEPPRVSPDSVGVSGAASVLEGIEVIHTEETELTNVQTDINVPIMLVKPNDLVELGTRQVQYTAKVAEYTEGELRTFVRAVEVPDDKNVTFSPSIITIKYDVPIQEYTRAQDIIPFTAHVPYQKLRDDSTGYVSPVISKTTDQLHVKLRSYQPKQVSYFRVIQNQE